MFELDWTVPGHCLDETHGAPFGALCKWLPGRQNLRKLIIEHPNAESLPRHIWRRRQDREEGDDNDYNDDDIRDTLSAWHSAALKLDAACRRQGVVIIPKNIAGLVTYVQEHLEKLVLAGGPESGSDYSDG